MANESISGIDLSLVTNPLSIFSQKTTDFIITFLAKYGMNVSQRWAGLLLFTLALIAFYSSLKITKPILKWIIIAMSILLILGLIMPSW